MSTIGAAIIYALFSTYKPTHHAAKLSTVCAAIWSAICATKRATIFTADFSAFINTLRTAYLPSIKSAK